METTNDTKSFSFRLRHTIAQLEHETAQGVENWTPTIDRLKATLAEIEQEDKSDNCAVALDAEDANELEEVAN